MGGPCVAETGGDKSVGGNRKSRSHQSGGTEYATVYTVRYIAHDGSERVGRVGVPDFLDEPVNAVGNEMTISYHPDRPRKIFHPHTLDSTGADVVLWAALAGGVLLVVVVAVQFLTAK